MSLSWTVDGLEFRGVNNSFVLVILFVAAWLHSVENHSSECWITFSEDLTGIKMSGKSQTVDLVLAVTLTQMWLSISGVANRSFAQSLLVDRAWFCIELTRNLKRTFFNQLFLFVAFYEIFLLVTLLPTGRSRVIKKFSSRSQSMTSCPPLVYLNRIDCEEEWKQHTPFWESNGRGERLRVNSTNMDTNFWAGSYWLPASNRRLSTPYLSSTPKSFS